MELFPKTQEHQENSRKQDTRTLKTDPLFYHAGLRISTTYINNDESWNHRGDVVIFSDTFSL